VGRAAAAKALGVTPVALSRMVERGAPAQKGAGGRLEYDVSKLRAWREQRAASHRPVADLATERARLARAQRILTNLKIGATRGDLLDRGAVVREGQAVMHALRSRLLAVPRQAVLAGLLPLEREADLRALVTATLRELSRWSAAPQADDAERGAVVAGPWSGPEAS
jgi:hypothetical protein